MPQVGLEPTRLSTLASKTSVATITPPGHLNTYLGSRGRDRTYDQLINSQLHYRCATLEWKWLRVKDSNLRLLGYEPSSLTTDVTRYNMYVVAGVSDRTRTCIKRICNP